MAAHCPTYHIIGAGIAGLSAAVHLQKKHPSAQVVVYDAAAHPGGRAYSFDCPEWGMALDTATHVILGANKNCLKLCGKDKLKNNIVFWDIKRGEKIKRTRCRNEIAEAVFNTACSDVSFRQWLNVLQQLFPFTPQRFKAGFSRGNLNELLIQPLTSRIKDMRPGWKLTGFTVQGQHIDSLLFGKRKIKLLPEDKVISALDSHSFARIFNIPDFDYHSIINIYFRTSMQVTLPENAAMLGLCNGFGQWLFCAPGLLAVTISNANHLTVSDDELARSIWQEICHIRGREAAFMPDYKVLHHKRATIKQDKANNSRRPSTAQTQWENLQICGDWTMKNYPCCLETAIRSALRLK